MKTTQEILKEIGERVRAHETAAEGATDTADKLSLKDKQLALMELHVWILTGA